MKQLQKKEAKKLFKEFKREKEIVLLLENIQYATNVAQIFRTADAAGVRNIYLTGISQKPPFGKDLRKTSRNKEQSVQWKYEETSGKVIESLKKRDYTVIAVEITDEGIIHTDLPEKLKNQDKICFVLGSEVYGVTKKTLERCHFSTFVPMYGRGASLNVGVSAGIILFSV